MNNALLIKHLGVVCARAKSGEVNFASLTMTISNTLRDYAPMPERVETLISRAKCTISKDCAISCLIEAQSVLMCIDLDAQSASGTGGIYGSANTNTLTTVAVGDILATEMRTCYPDLLKKVEALTRYDIFDVYASSSEIDEVDDGKYLKREDVIRLLGGDA